MGKDARHNTGWTFYYDGDCGLCAGVVRWLSQADLFNHVAWVPSQTQEQPPCGLSWDDLDAAAYLDTGRGALHEGFDGFRMLTLRLLPLLPLAPILWFPGARRLGVPAYRWVARNRYRLSRCRIPGAGGRSSYIAASAFSAAIMAPHPRRPHLPEDRREKGAPGTADCATHVSGPLRRVSVQVQP